MNSNPAENPNSSENLEQEGSLQCLRAGVERLRARVHGLRVELERLEVRVDLAPLELELDRLEEDIIFGSAEFAEYERSLSFR